MAAELQAKGAKATKNALGGFMSGKALFTYDPSLFQDDDNAADDKQYDEDSDDENKLKPVEESKEEDDETKVDEALF